MPDFTAYIRANVPVASLRAALAWRRIQGDPTSITVLRGAANLEPQTVRIEFKTLPSEAAGGAGRASVRRAVVFGVKGHTQIADTDLQKGDRFVLGGTREYRIVDVAEYPGELQATAERTL